MMRIHFHFYRTFIGSLLFLLSSQILAGPGLMEPGKEESLYKYLATVLSSRDTQELLFRIKDKINPNIDVYREYQQVRETQRYPTPTAVNYRLLHEIREEYQVDVELYKKMIREALVVMNRKLCVEVLDGKQDPVMELYLEGSKADHQSIRQGIRFVMSQLTFDRVTKKMIPSMFRGFYDAQRYEDPSNFPLAVLTSDMFSKQMHWGYLVEGFSQELKASVPNLLAAMGKTKDEYQNFIDKSAELMTQDNKLALTVFFRKCDFSFGGDLKNLAHPLGFRGTLPDFSDHEDLLTKWIERMGSAAKAEKLVKAYRNIGHYNGATKITQAINDLRIPMSTQFKIQ